MICVLVSTSVLIVPLDMKGCICHFTKWQIHPFISMWTTCASGMDGNIRFINNCIMFQCCVPSNIFVTAQWAHDIIVTLNQRKWRWVIVETTSRRPTQWVIWSLKLYLHCWQNDQYEKCLQNTQLYNLQLRFCLRYVPAHLIHKLT